MNPPKMRRRCVRPLSPRQRGVLEHLRSLYPNGMPAENQHYQYIDRLVRTHPPSANTKPSQLASQIYTVLNTLRHKGFVKSKGGTCKYPEAWVAMPIPLPYGTNYHERDKKG